MKSCILLCGGQSRRMGKDKGSLVIKDKPMIVHILNTLNNEVDEVIVVLNNKKRIEKYKKIITDEYLFSIRFVEDIIKDKGPISGIMTGLKEISGDYALVLPCDSPFVSKNHVNYLFDEFNDSYDALIPFNDSENKVKSSEPLHGIYKKSNFELIEKLIQKDILNIKGLIEKINCKFIKIENKKEYENLNHPDDLNKFH